MIIDQIIGILDGTCFATTRAVLAGKFLNGGKYYRYVVDVVLSRFVTIFTLFDRLALMIEFSTIQTKDSFLLSRSGRKVFVCLTLDKRSSFRGNTGRG